MRFPSGWEKWDPVERVPTCRALLLFACGRGAGQCTQDSKMPPFQIIFNPTSANELSRMPKELQLQILGDFRGIPTQVRTTEMDQFGKLEQGGRVLHRFRVGEYRVYFERHDLGVVVHRILSRNTLKDFLYRSGLKVAEDEALQANPHFWELIETATHAAKN